jgi:hypothetical protein
MYTDDNIVHFPNISGDATLIVPKPTINNIGAHLAYFMRNNESSHVHQLWKVMIITFHG